MTTHDATPQPLLSALAGTWHARNHLWFRPDESGHESDTTLVVTPAVRELITSLRYTWSHDGTPHEGVLLVRDASPNGPPAMVWADSFHTSGTFMSLGPGTRSDTSIAATGSYAAPPGPDWGWRIELHVTDPGELLVRHYNILPDGFEALAIEARYTRAG
jgi:hypothetical protein